MRLLKRKITVGMATAALIAMVFPVAGGASASMVAASTKDFKIGVVTSLSGNYAFIGNPTVLGVNAAVKVLNKQGGVNGRKVVMIVCNDETNPAVARTCYDKLVKSNKVDILIGFPLAAATEAVEPLVRRDKIPTWVLGGSYGGRDLNKQKYMFSGLPTTNSALNAAFEWAKEKNFKKAWIIATDDVTGAPCRSFPSASSKLRSGITVAGVSTMSTTTKTAATQVAEIDRSVDFVFLCASGGAGIVAATSYYQANLPMPAIAIHSQSAAFVAGAMKGRIPDNKLLVMSFCPLGVVTGQFKNKYKCEVPAREFVKAARAFDPTASIDVLTAHAYDGAYLLTTAAKKTDGKADSIVKYMESLRNFPAALGSYTFTDKIRRGIDNDQFLLGVFRGGAWYVQDPLNLVKK